MRRRFLQMGGRILYCILDYSTRHSFSIISLYYVYANDEYQRYRERDLDNNPMVIFIQPYCVSRLQNATFFSATAIIYFLFHHYSKKMRR